MSEHHDEATEPLHHHHECCNLFGCGDEKGTGVLREDIKDAAYQKRSADRLLHGDEVDQEKLDAYLSARGRARRDLMRASGFMGLLAAVEPWFGKLAQAQAPGATARHGQPAQRRGPSACRRIHQGERAARCLRRQSCRPSSPSIQAIRSASPTPGRTF